MTDKQIKQVEEELRMLKINDVAKITGWGINRTREIFVKDNEFPAIKIGKSYQVTFEALLKYLSTRRILEKE